MFKMILPLIPLSLTIIMAIVYAIMSNKKPKTYKDIKTSAKNTVQEFLNILDIRNNIIYGKDDFKRVVLSLEGICIDLLNKNDTKRLIRTLTSEISKLNIEFDLCSMPQPFNIDSLKKEYEDNILNANTDIQRTLLRHQLNRILEYGENGNVTERKFYIIIQGLDEEIEILKNASLIQECFKNANIKCLMLKEKELVRFVNLYYNFTTYNYDDISDTEKTVPLLDIDKEKEKTIDEKVQEKLENEKGKEGV